MEKENVQFRKNFIWNVLGTGLNAFNSLFFMIIVTRLNGVDQAGIFTIAFSTACIIYFVGVYAGRIYQVTELNKEIIEALNHFIDYTGSNFDLVCKDGCILIRGHFNCIFDPNIYLGHMPKKLLYTYYRNLYEFILLVNKVNENINH